MDELAINLEQGGRHSLDTGSDFFPLGVDALAFNLKLDAAWFGNGAEGLPISDNPFYGSHIDAFGVDGNLVDNGRRGEAHGLRIEVGKDRFHTLPGDPCQDRWGS